MAVSIRSFDPRGHMPASDQEWHELMLQLRRKVSRHVYSWEIPSWCGQEPDIVDDATQEGIVRTLAHADKAVRGLVPPILSFSALSTVTSVNYARDIRRKDSHLVRSSDTLHESYMCAYQWIVDPSELAVEAVSLAPLFALIASIIDGFPQKQKRAMLIDLAHLAHFNLQPTFIGLALEEVGIHLNDYYLPLPTDPRLRKQHASNLSIAYSRLREEALKQPYILEFVA